MNSGTLTTGSCFIDYPWAGGGCSTPTVYYYNTMVSPSECSGDVHVFPCPHCDKCKCGKASVKREKRGKDGN